MGLGAVAAGTLATGAIGAVGASNAASEQAHAANNATATQLAMFNQTQQNLSPYMQSGTNALGQLNAGLNGGAGSGATALPTYGSTIAGMTNPADYSAAQYQQSPGYQFQLQQGLGAITNSAAASGGIVGGNTLKALQTYGQGLANQDYQQSYENYLNNYNTAYNSQLNNSNTAFNRLNTLATSGQNAAANLGTQATQVGSNVANTQMAAGQAEASGTMGISNALGSLVSPNQNASLTQLAYASQNTPPQNGPNAGW